MSFLWVWFCWINFWWISRFDSWICCCDVDFSLVYVLYSGLSWLVIWVCGGWWFFVNVLCLYLIYVWFVCWCFVVKLCVVEYWLMLFFIWWWWDFDGNWCRGSVCLGEVCVLFWLRSCESWGIGVRFWYWLLYWRICWGKVGFVCSFVWIVGWVVGVLFGRGWCWLDLSLVLCRRLDLGCGWCRRFCYWCYNWFLVFFCWWGLFDWLFGGRVGCNIDWVCWILIVVMLLVDFFCSWSWKILCDCWFGEC